MVVVVVSTNKGKIILLRKYHLKNVILSRALLADKLLLLFRGSCSAGQYIVCRWLWLLCIRVKLVVGISSYSSSRRGRILLLKGRIEMRSACTW